MFLLDFEVIIRVEYDKSDTIDGYTARVLVLSKLKK